VASSFGILISIFLFEQESHKSLYAFVIIFILQSTQLFGVDRGLYFLYVIFHESCSKHRWQRKSSGVALIFLVILLFAEVLS